MPTSGFSTGVVSNTNVIFNNFAQPATITAVGAATFDLYFFYGTAGFIDASPLGVNVTGIVTDGMVRLLIKAFENVVLCHRQAVPDS